MHSFSYFVSAGVNSKFEADGGGPSTTEHLKRWGAGVLLTDGNDMCEFQYGGRVEESERAGDKIAEVRCG